MKSLFYFALFCGLSASSTFARIGETEAQIEKRYGKTLIADKFRGHKMSVYRKGGFQIGVVFVDGKSAAEIFSKLDKAALTATEIEVLLRANGSNGTWNKPAEDVPMWKLEPGGLTATFDRRTLTVCTSDFLAASKAEAERAEKEKLKDF